MKHTFIILSNIKLPISSAVMVLRQGLSLPLPLHNLVIGLLLGDAGVYRTTKSPTSNSRLEFSFGQHRILFAKWIESMFEAYIQTSLKHLYVSSVSGGDKVHKSFRLKTLSLPLFNFYRDLFYVWDEALGKFVKIIPSNIIDLLSPAALAAFVMGDGNYQPDANTIRIYTNGFTHADVILLAEGITMKYGIIVGVRHDRKQQYILAIGSLQIDKFRSLVLPYMEPSMLHRIGL